MALNRRQRRKAAKQVPRLSRSHRMTVAAKALDADFQRALSCQREGRLAEAEKVYREMLKSVPGHDGINCNLATVLYGLGRWDAAAEACAAALVATPSMDEAHALLGAVEVARGNLSAAIDSYHRALQINPEFITVLVGLADLYRVHGELAKAISMANRAEALTADRPDVLCTRAGVRQAQGDANGAEDDYRRAVAASTGHSDDIAARALTGLGAILAFQGNNEEAAACCLRAIAIDPSLIHAHSTLGVALMGLGQFAEAEPALAAAAELAPKIASTHSNLGAALSNLERPAEALAAYDRALACDVNLVEAHNNRGNVLGDLGRDAEALAAFDRALSIDPDFSDARFNRALALLISGSWRDAWLAFDWRWKTVQMAPFRRNFAEPQWDGRNLPDATLLVHAEQGFGDTLQFIRYLPMIAGRVGRVVVECQPPVLVLLRGITGCDAWVAAGDPLPEFDIHLPMLGLPGVCRTEVATIPGNTPYLEAIDTATVALPEALGKLKVGLVWAGNPRNPADRRRSMALTQLTPLLEVEGCTFYGLQVGPNAGQIAAAGLENRIIDLSPQLTDFSTTAAAITQLDLLISVCTATAHLAGGLAKPVWIMLSANADWRWLRNRDDTPWYPTARLFRQQNPGDWDNLAVQVAAALQEKSLSAATRCL